MRPFFRECIIREQALAAHEPEDVLVVDGLHHAFDGALLYFMLLDRLIVRGVGGMRLELSDDFSKDFLLVLVRAA